MMTEYDRRSEKRRKLEDLSVYQKWYYNSYWILTVFSSYILVSFQDITVTVTGGRSEAFCNFF